MSRLYFYAQRIMHDVREGDAGQNARPRSALSAALAMQAPPRRAVWQEARERGGPFW